MTAPTPSFCNQYVLRTNKDFRGYAGLTAGGIRSGQTVKILPSGKVTTIERVFIGMDEVEGARLVSGCIYGAR